MVVGLALIDSGDNTDAVYDFCADNSDWALPSKGSSHPMDTHFKISKVNRTDSKAYGMQLAIIDTGKYKDMIAGRMKRKNGTGSWMVYQGCDLEYAEQVTSEHKVNEKSGNRVVQVWRQKTSHADNHYLDCEVYAMCAADMQGARTLHLEEVEMPPRKEAPPEPESSPEENWIGQNESWLQGGE
jgi:phage terminase large subunit GpA-like protein